MRIRINHQQQADVLKEHGKTFYFAGMLLGQAEFERATALYSFLRNVDDTVDETNDRASATRRLNSIRYTLTYDTTTVDESDSTSIVVSNNAITEFLRGMEFDIGHVAVRDKLELEDYCYCVAGTVGEMMCAALQCSDSRAISHAIDLGIAMQMTNIARDVFEDASRERRYLPSSWVGGLSPEQILQASGDEEAVVKDSICKLIKNARIRYRHARRGIVLLPFRSRLAILTASYLYQEIGEQILSENAIRWQQRERVSFIKKVVITVKCTILFLVSPQYWRYSQRAGIGRPKKRNKLLLLR